MKIRRSLLTKTTSCLLLMVFLTRSMSAYALDNQALPTGGQITPGSGTISQSGANMTVNQSTPQMIINWNTFNIGSQASVNFIQPGASSVALNRVSGVDPSYIFGNLTANGKVFLLNPSGVIFGPSSSINVGGLVASSLNLSDMDFLNGNYHFTNGANAGNILNQGNIQGAVVALIAPQVSNQGTISSPGGAVALAAGDDVNLDFTGDGLLTVKVNAADINALVENKNLIQADGGMVVMTAQAAGDLMATVVNNNGIIQARGISTRNGQIFLDGGPQGITRTAGTLDVSNTQGAGGQITVTGDKVLVDKNAHLNAAGTTGGGAISAGGSWEGGPAIRQANEIYVAKTAVLDASATNIGNGGTVVARSDVNNPDSATWAYGTFLASGGPNGGNGGRIETSGHWLDTQGAQGGANAPLGKAGQWLFDPYNVTISGADANGSFTAGTWTPSNTSSTILNTDINTLLQGGTSVTITTYDGGAGGDIGDLTDSANITKASGNADVTLTLEAAYTIVINNPISNTGGTGKLNVTIDADNNNGAGDGVGIILLNANITTNGGNLNFGTGRTTTVNNVANTLVGGDTYVGGTGASAITLSTNGGAMNVEGQMIVADSNGFTINTSGGNVRFYSLLDSGDTYAYTANSSIDWSTSLTTAKTGTGANVGDAYLATITSRLENSIAAYTANYNPSWLGARRVIGIGTNAVWRWVTGPEGLQNSGQGLEFFTQNGSNSSNGSGGTAIGGAYYNWNAGEPNNSGGSNLSSESESALQFVGNLGLWNDLPKTGNVVSGYVTETNLANSPVTVNAGSGTVTFSGAVGGNKELNSLTVTGSSIAINGGAVTTAGLQTYNDPVTVGSASTTLTQTNADTDFAITSSMPITNAYGADATLTINTTRDIVMEANTSISSSSGKLGVTFDSDSDVSSGGAIVMDPGSSISSNGGNIVLGGGADPTTGYAQGRDGVADSSNGISIFDASLTSSGGGITLLGKSAAVAAMSSAGFSTAFGVDVAHSTGTSSTIDSGSGKISITGISTRTSGGDGHGVELGTAGSTTTGKITSASTASDAIVISGTASSTSVAGTNDGGVTNFQTIETTNGGGIQITGTGGPTTVGFDGGIFSKGNILTNSGTITLTGTGGVGGGSTQDVYFDAGAYTGYKAATDVTSSSGNIIINANSISINSTSRLQSTGSLTIQPVTAATSVGIAGGAGTLSLPASYFSTNFVDGFSQLNIGSTSAGNLTLGADTAFNDNIALISNSNINLNAAVNASGQTVTLTDGSGATTSGSGNITADSLLLNGGGATYTLNTASGNSVSTIASTGVTAVNYINNGSFSVGTVGSTNGVTATGNITLQANGFSADLTLCKPVTTTSGIITLASGRNFINNNASNTGLVPGTGQYLVYSTDPAASTRGMTSYNKHYNQGYSSGSAPSYASSGNWFLYSIPATITVTNSSATINYGDPLPTFTHSISGFIDGDTISDLLGIAVYSVSGTTDGAGNYTSGIHQVNYASGFSTNFGYIISSSSGVLTVNQTLPSTSSIVSTATGVTGTTETSNKNATTDNNSINPGSGATTLTAAQTNSLVSQPMSLTTGSFTQAISLTSSGTTTTLSFSGISTGTATEAETQSGVSVFISHGNTIKPDGNFNVVDKGSQLSLTQNGQNTNNVPTFNSTATQAGSFSVNTASGIVVELSVSMTAEGVMMIKIPAGTNGLDTQSITLTGLAVVKQKLNLSVDKIKSIIIVQ